MNPTATAARGRLHRRGRALLACAGLALALAAQPARASLLELPSIDRIVQYQPKQPLQVLTADGVEIGQFGAERRQFVPLAQIPPLLQQAVLAVEDTRFHEHSGVDPKGMARAALALLTGGMRQGASTITQQLVRTMLLTHRFTPQRKAQEIVLALKVEQALPKERILEIYLNEIYLGQRAYGFAAAAQTYFGKPMDRLSLAETAMLAGLPQNPNYANPVADLGRAVARQRVVLQRMRATGVISEARHAAALSEKLVIRPPGRQAVPAAHVAEMARRVVVERFGTGAYTSGLRVVTSLRAADQQAAHAAVRRGVLAHDRRQPWRGPEDHEALPDGDGPALERAAAQALRGHRDDETLRVAIVLAASPRELRLQLADGTQVAVGGEGLRRAQAWLRPGARATPRLERGSVVRVVREGRSWSLAQWPEVEAAFVALDPASGRIRALVGGFDFSRQPLNHVTQAWRQPGSSLKPLLASAALEQRVMPATRIDDLPFVAADGWSPHNSDGRFDGPVSLREALARSRNLPAVRLLQHVGVGEARAWLGRFGLDTARQPEDLTLALGTGSVTPLQMAQAYAVVASGGWRVPTVLVERILDAQGRVLFEAPPAAAPAESQRVLSPRNAFVTASLLGEVTRSGTAARVQQVLGRDDLHGKTGTSDEAVDAWFAGFHPSLVAVAWVGHGQPRSLGERESGGAIALPIWIDFMAEALRGVPPAPLPDPPPGVVREGPDWLYTEWLRGGWVDHIAADGKARLAPEPGQPLPLPGDGEPARQP